MKEKYVNTQARLVWWFSNLCRQQPKVKGSAALARGGAEFMLKNFWDPKHGGWYWQTKPNGCKSDTGKIVYGECPAS